MTAKLDIAVAVLSFAAGGVCFALNDIQWGLVGVGAGYGLVLLSRLRT